MKMKEGIRYDVWYCFQDKMQRNSQCRFTSLVSYSIVSSLVITIYIIVIRSRFIVLTHTHRHQVNLLVK